MSQNALTLCPPLPLAVLHETSRAPDFSRQYASPRKVNLNPLTTYDLDRLRHAFQAHLTAGVSPAAVIGAFADWFIHLANAPTKQLRLAEQAVENMARLTLDLSFAGPQQKMHTLNSELSKDRRFSGADWMVWPFNIFGLSFLLTESLWNEATSDVRGSTTQHERVVNFTMRQIMDSFAPTNFFWTNPEVLRTTVQSGGLNLVKGAENFIYDFGLVMFGKPLDTESPYHVGENLAVTKGKVVYRNRLMELIQYAPTTDKVFAEPLLIVPAWIMKYYILDLSPENSLVRYLVGQGYTVFMISWHNPNAEDRDLGMEDYRKLGVMAALDVIGEILPERRVHACGYCLGGTLLAIAAASMVEEQDDRLASMTMLASETDFSEAGELMLYINESQVSYLEDMMWAQGYLDTKQMAGAFQLLRSNDLILSRVIRHYWLGQPTKLNDLMAWNADATRMPYRMHAEYLRQLFLENRLSRGLYEVNNRPITLNDIHVPLFVVSTTHDHIAPWKSVFKIHLQSKSDVTFVLTEGGHNAGIVSEPGHPDRSFRVRTHKVNESYIDPDRWMNVARCEDGSWWPVWSEWMEKLSSGKTAPPSMGSVAHVPLCDAPGKYVFEK